MEKTQKLPPAKTVLKPIEIFTNEPNVPPGKAWVVRVKPDGTEIPNSGFLVGEGTADRVYAHNAKFKVKKKHFN